MAAMSGQCVIVRHTLRLNISTNGIFRMCEDKEEAMPNNIDWCTALYADIEEARPTVW